MIKDSQITASSETENGTRDQSRLNSGPEKAWCVQESDRVRTLTIDLLKKYSISQVRVLTRESNKAPLSNHGNVGESCNVPNMLGREGGREREGWGRGA